ncbi:MAG: D-glycero-beta-D-manno-heptose-7-phosphate kinase [Proteobacteria bacterium]|nr:D-glycero-beta-D-manno-heptose-7-phosphate kinase [Pseudomonadota bacterium]
MKLEFDKARVLIVGDSMLDRYIRGAIERISPEAPVPVLRRSETRFVPGGAANVAANVAALGASVVLVTHIGDDLQGDALRRDLADKGIAVDAIAQPGRPTTCKTRLMAGNHQILRLDDEECAHLPAQFEDRLIEIVSAHLFECDALVLSDYGKGLLTDRVIAALIESAQDRGIPSIVDPKRADWTVYRGASYITPNRAELERASGIAGHSDDEAERAAAAAFGLSGAAILMTRSEKGMSLFRDGHQSVHVPTKAREVFDVSGAGDTVVATLAASLAAGLQPEAAMHCANQAAGIVVGKIGTAVVSLAELKAAIETRDADEPQAVAGAMPLAAAIAIRDEWRARGLRVGFTNGCFDLVHPGHVQILTRSAALCDRLIVAVNSDASVSRLKGPSRPVQSEQARAIVLSAFGCVDAVVIFDDDTPLRCIEALEPDVLIKGADYRIETVVGADFVLARGGRVELIDLVPEQSTSRLIARAGLESA